LKRIKNPFVNFKDYNCFGCSKANKEGLQMEFYEHRDEIISYWYPEKRFQGYDNILHGGIQGILIDEVAAWYVFVKLKTAGVTSKIEILYKNPVYIDKGQITVKGTLKVINDNIATMLVRIFDIDGNLCSEATVDYFLFPENIAKTKFLYPGAEKFTE
jgi:acyl-coenzyme A thioesterase PaaI-like protein